MIPKKIHYCWFGNNSKSKLIQKCISSWKEFAPDYEIIEWNESNIDFQACPDYVKEAYDAKKWAFVTDYIRMSIIYNEGGIYFDTDVELIKPLDDLLNYDLFFATEHAGMIASGLGFGAVAHNQVIKENMDYYNNKHFFREDGSIDITPCPIINTSILVAHGYKQEDTLQLLENNIVVFPVDYFCPFDFNTRRLNKTHNTYAIHWYNASWHTPKQRWWYFKKKIKRFIRNLHEDIKKSFS